MKETAEDIRAIRELLRGRGTVTIQVGNGAGITASKAAIRAAILEAGEPEYVTTEEAARILNVSRPYVVKLVDTGELPSVTTHGGHRRIPREELSEYSEQMRRTRRAALAEMRALGEEDGLYVKALEEAVK